MSKVRLWMMIVLLGLPATYAAEVPINPESRLEREFVFLGTIGVNPTPAAVLEYVRTYIPQNLSREEAEAFSRQLGSSDYHEREDASQRLIQSPNFPDDVLNGAAESDDLEIRWRARLVRSQRGKRDWRFFQSALRVLAEKPPAETLEVVLELSAYYLDESNLNLIHRVLTTIAREEDAAKLERIDEQSPLGKRFAVAVALRELRPQLSRDRLAKLTVEPHPHIALQAAKRLGNLGDRRALPPLVKLVSSEDRVIAEESACFLRTLSQYEFNLPAIGAAEEFITLQANLKHWLTVHGETVELRFPVLESAIIRGDLAGNVLVSNGSRVMELNPAGKEVWAYPIQAWSAEKLRRGTVLIASYQANQILEVNQEGNVVWKLDGVNAMRAKPLADDHILVAHFSGSRVFELNAQRQEVWTHTTPDNCFDAERLPNGNTVFACPGLIREITREGTTVRSLDVDGRVNSLQILPTGDYLLANYGKHQVQQYDKTGKIVWRFEENSPNDAFRLKNGNTLVTSATRCVEVDPTGRVIRTIQQASNYGCARK